MYIMEKKTNTIFVCHYLLSTTEQGKEKYIIDEHSTEYNTKINSIRISHAYYLKLGINYICLILNKTKLSCYPNVKFQVLYPLIQGKQKYLAVTPCCLSKH